MHRKFIYGAALCGALLTGLVLHPALAADYYVHPVSGEDGNAGTKAAPWKTAAFALSEKSPLGAGDTLYLRGGSYHETSIWTYKKGEPGKPVTIRNVPGETPVFHGSDPDYETAPNKQWEAHDAAKGIYKSIKTWPVAPYGSLYETGGKQYGLIAYRKYEQMASEDEHYNNEGLYYAGPGYYFNPDDKKLYIRLKHPDPAMHGKNIKLTHSLNPNQVRMWIPIRIAAIDYPVAALNFENGRYIDVIGLHFGAYGAKAITVWNNGENFNFKDITVNSLGGGIRLRKIKNGTVDNLVHDGMIPPYTCWNDCKSSGVSYSVSAADGIEILANCSNVEIKNSRFNGSFDGIRMHSAIDYPTSGINIHDNVFQDIDDDSISLGVGLFDTNIHHNRFLNVSKSISRVGGAEAHADHPLGRVYIHHNIIAIGPTYQTRKSATEPPLNLHHAVFGTHGIDYGTVTQPWKLYNNAIFTGSPIGNDGGLGHELTGSKVMLFDPAKPEAYDRESAHEVYNNVFVLKGDFHLGRTASVGSGQEIYDGNIYWKTAPKTPPFPFFNPMYENVGKPNPKMFPTLAAFKADPWFALSQKYYPAGWENSGLEADPKLNADYTPIPGGPASKPGIDLSARKWPDANQTAYRGAIAPKK